MLSTIIKIEHFGKFAEFVEACKQAREGEFNPANTGTSVYVLPHTEAHVAEAGVMWYRKQDGVEYFHRMTVTLSAIQRAPESAEFVNILNEFGSRIDKFFQLVALPASIRTDT